MSESVSRATFQFALVYLWEEKDDEKNVDMINLMIDWWWYTW